MSAQNILVFMTVVFVGLTLDRKFPITITRAEELEEKVK